MPLAKHITRTAPVTLIAAAVTAVAFASPATATSRPPSDPDIIGGTESPTNAYPWMVSLSLPGIADHFCGGTLIDRSWVLTAAH